MQQEHAPIDPRDSDSPQPREQDFSEWIEIGHLLRARGRIGELTGRLRCLPARPS